MRETSPVKLIGSVTKSRGYFCHARWKGRRKCIKCNFRMCIILRMINVMDVNDVGTNLMILLDIYRRI